MPVPDGRIRIKDLTHAIDIGSMAEWGTGPASLRVGLCSLSGKSITNFVGTGIRGQQYGFRADNVRMEGTDANAGKDGYLKELRACLAWAIDAGIHILCLPELCVCADGRNMLAEELSKARGKLVLVLAGSYHEQMPDGAYNSAPIWPVPLSSSLRPFSAKKAAPYSSSVATQNKRAGNKPNGITRILAQAESAGVKEILEDIAVGEPTIIVSPLGIFCVAICRDQMTPEWLTAATNVAIDHIFNVSMNDSAKADYLEKITRSRGVATFCVNAAQVVDDEKTRLCFWAFPAGQSGAFTLQNAGEIVRRVDGFDLFGAICEVPIPQWGTSI